MNYNKLFTITFAVINVSIATLHSAQDQAVEEMRKAGFSQEEIQALCNPQKTDITRISRWGRRSGNDSYGGLIDTHVVIASPYEVDVYINAPHKRQCIAALPLSTVYYYYMKEQYEKTVEKADGKAQEKEKDSAGISQPCTVSTYGSLLHALPQFGGGLRDKD